MEKLFNIGKAGNFPFTWHGSHRGSKRKFESKAKSGQKKEHVSLSSPFERQTSHPRQQLLPSFQSVAAPEILAKHVLNSALQKSFIYLDTTLGWPCNLDSSAHIHQLAGKKSEYDY